MATIVTELLNEATNCDGLSLRACVCVYMHLRTNRGDSSEWTVLLADLVTGVSVRSEWPFGCQVVCNACDNFGAVSHFIAWQKGIYDKTYGRYIYTYIYIYTETMARTTHQCGARSGSPQ